MTSSLSAAERRFLVDGVAQDVRNDARASGTFRRAFVETGVFESCAGSARVRVGAADVSVGVKLRVVPTKSDAPLEGFLECSVDAAAAKLDATSDDLAQALFRAYNQGRCLNLKSLCIAPHQLCWCVHLDAIVHSGDGNLLDVLSIAARAALHNTRVPAVRAIGAGDELELDVDADVAAGLPLDISRVPVCVTLTRVGAQQHFVVDATREELLCSSGAVAVAVNALGRTCALEKRGLAALDPATLFTMLHTASAVAAQLIAAVDRLLADGAQMRADSRGFMN